MSVLSCTFLIAYAFEGKKSLYILEETALLKLCFDSQGIIGEMGKPGREGLIVSCSSF